MRVITETTESSEVLETEAVETEGGKTITLPSFKSLKSKLATGVHVTKAVVVAPVHVAGSKWDRHVSYSTAKKALKEEMIREGKALRS